MGKEISTIDELVIALNESMDNSTLMRSVRNTLSNLIGVAYSENNYDLSMYEYSDKLKAIKVLERLNSVMDKIDPIVESII